MTPPMTPREKVASLKTNDPTNPAHRLARDLQAQRYASLEARDDMADVLLEREAILAENAALRARIETVLQGECECCVLTRAECADAIAETEIGRAEAERKLAEAVGLVKRSVELMTDEYADTKSYRSDASTFLSKEAA